MTALSVCASSSGCCIGLGEPLTSSDPISRVFIGVGQSCTSAPPLTGGVLNSGWVEASSITALGGDQYQPLFPPFAASDPRCVTPCDASYSVCIGILTEEGHYSCSTNTAFNPASHCAAQPGGFCVACMEAPEIAP